MLRDNLPPPSVETIILICGPHGLEKLVQEFLIELGYSNEMFFTLRFVSSKNLIKSLKYKYSEYCMVASGKTRFRRTILFIFGLLTALYRLSLNKQVTAEEFK